MTQETQPTPPALDPPAAPAPKKSRVVLAKVMIRGEGVVYERKKLWPQGPDQTVAGQCAYAVYIVQLALEGAEVKKREAKTHGELRAANESIEKLKKDLAVSLQEADHARTNARMGSSVIEAVVGDMYLIDGDMATNKPATIEILGMPFGEWAARRASITATVPQAGALWENLWPLDEFEEHARKLEAAADEEENAPEEEDEDDEEGDEDGDDDDEEGDEDGDDEPDDDEPLVQVTRTPPALGGGGSGA